ncbi:hypothetical protein HK104_004686 [Borealophlyctis nickersoniae]|nr:hypothetical protein HK104_004686 [Borealophlyctis nickersoniae]
MLTLNHFFFDASTQGMLRSLRFVVRELLGSSAVDSLDVAMAAFTAAVIALMSTASISKIKTIQTMQLPQRDVEETLVAFYLKGYKGEIRRSVSINSDNLVDLLTLKSAALRVDQVVVKPSTPRQQSNALTAQDEKEGDETESSLFACGGRGGGGRGGGGGNGWRGSGGDGGGGWRRPDWLKSAQCANCNQIGHVWTHCPTMPENLKQIAKNLKKIRAENFAKKKNDEEEKDIAHLAMSAFVVQTPKENAAPTAPAKRLDPVPTNCRPHHPRAANEAACVSV